MTCFYRFLSLFVFVLLVANRLFGQPSADGDLFTTNRDQVQHFWSAVDNSNGPVTVLAFGYSMAASYQSIQVFLFGSLQKSLGISGYSLGNVWNAILWQLGNGAYESGPTTNWWTTHGVLPPGAFLYSTNFGSATGSLVCDRVGVFWIAKPDGGALPSVFPPTEEPGVIH